MSCGCRAVWQLLCFFCNLEQLTGCDQTSRVPGCFQTVGSRYDTEDRFGCAFFPSWFSQDTWHLDSFWRFPCILQKQVDRNIQKSVWWKAVIRLGKAIELNVEATNLRASSWECTLNFLMYQRLQDILLCLVGSFWEVWHAFAGELNHASSFVLNCALLLFLSLDIYKEHNQIFIAVIAHHFAEVFEIGHGGGWWHDPGTGLGVECVPCRKLTSGRLHFVDLCCNTFLHGSSWHSWQRCHRSLRSSPLILACTTSIRSNSTRFQRAVDSCANLSLHDARAEYALIFIAPTSLLGF